MKTIFSLVLLLASASAFAGDSTSSGSSDFISTTSESVAYATFLGGDGGCIVTESFVYTNKSLHRINLEEWTVDPPFVWVISMTRRNSCTGVLEFSASGIGPVTSFWHGDGGASVTANIQVRDTVGNRMPVSINLVWNTFGVRTDSNSEVKESYPGPEGIYTITAIRDTRIVSGATGSVSDGTYEYAGQYQSATWAQTKTKFRTNAPAQ